MATEKKAAPAKKATAKKPAAKTPAKKAASKKPAPVEAAKATPAHHEIAMLAWSYWVERGHQHGHADQDWLRAERELKGA